MSSTATAMEQRELSPRRLFNIRFFMYAARVDLNQSMPAECPDDVGQWAAYSQLSPPGNPRICGARGTIVAVVTALC